MLSNDMDIDVQKTHLVAQILYRSLVPCKKNGVHKNTSSHSFQRKMNKWQRKYDNKDAVFTLGSTFV